MNPSYARPNSPFRLALVLLGCGLCVGPVCAQGHGGGGGAGQGSPRGQAPGRDDQGGCGPGFPGGQPGMGGAGAGGRGGIPPSTGRGPSQGVPAGPGGFGGSQQMGPGGRWWDDRNYSRALNLRAEQKSKMDAIFNGNRRELTTRFQALRQEEARLEEATRDPHLKQESIFGQIDRVAQARDALEKANAQLMLSLRKELDTEQAARLQTLK